MGLGRERRAVSGSGGQGVRETPKLQYKNTCTKTLKQLVLGVQYFVRAGRLGTSVKWSTTPLHVRYNSCTTQYIACMAATPWSRPNVPNTQVILELRSDKE